MKSVKRKRVNWRDVMLDLGDQRIEADYCLFLQKHLSMSINRCAYYVLKKYYTTTAIAYFREFGHFPGQCSWEEEHIK